VGDIVEVVGVYDADGGWRGELAYVVGHLLGRAECALCDVTHSPVRRKPAWTAMVARLPVPMRLVHRNETSDAERASVSELPVVLGMRQDGSHVRLLDRRDLAALDGSVECFDSVLRGALERAAIR
jgi:hypothetical protein